MRMDGAVMAQPCGPASMPGYGLLRLAIGRAGGLDDVRADLGLEVTPDGLHCLAPGLPFGAAKLQYLAVAGLLDFLAVADVELSSLLVHGIGHLIDDPFQLDADVMRN